MKAQLTRFKAWVQSKVSVRAQTPTNLNIVEWSRHRVISLSICILIYAILIAATLYSSVTFWASHFKTAEVGVGFALLVDGLAIATLIFRVTRIQFPLNWLRHALPLTTVVPVFLFAEEQLRDLALAVTVSVVVLGFSFVLQRHIEGLFVSPEELAKEAVYANAQGLLNEQLRRIAVDQVLGSFAQESKQVTATAKETKQLTSTVLLRRDEFIREYAIATKYRTEAYQAYVAGRDYSKYVNTLQSR